MHNKALRFTKYLCLTITWFGLLENQVLLSPVSAFAGGFGANVSKKSPKRKKRKGNQRELSELSSPSIQPTNPSKEKLDKWGLPEITEDDLFPQMPDGTELIPIDGSKDYSLSEIQLCLNQHLDLKLERHFDQNGVEIVSDDREPMKVRLLHESPPVLAIDNFFSGEECKQIKCATNSAHEVNSATFSGALSTRTSTSWFCRYSDVPILLAKANQLLNIELECMEEPQIVRYRKGQEFSFHYDEVPSRALENGGQRVATLLVYLSDINPKCGGGTEFRDLKTVDSQSLVMQPKQGSALLFFPAYKDGRPDDRTLHRSQVMDCDDEKWIVQMWVHERKYDAVLPAGNSNQAARSVMMEEIEKLGYNNKIL